MPLMSSWTTRAASAWAALTAASSGTCTRSHALHVSVTEACSPAARRSTCAPCSRETAIRSPGSSVPLNLPSVGRR
eukprot:8372829-Lingulodinium_polyedra.AAC.1